jgi:hypothetical protein
LTDNAVSETDSPHGGEDAFAVPSAPLLLRREVARCHEVQFYSDESHSLDGFARFISAALKTGNVVVFVGTASHRRILLEKLHSERPDNRASVRQERYVALDAEEFLSNFVVDDMPDPNAFLKIADDLIIASANRTNREPLRVSLCGECAPILWAKGNADAAIRLEELWNKVARTHDVDIFCGYSLESLRCDEDSYTFRRICEEHSVAHSC